jgi:hypothetical protein
MGKRRVSTLRRIHRFVNKALRITRTLLIGLMSGLNPVAFSGDELD